MANHNRPTNAFPKGNQLYKNVIAIGRKKKYTTPEALWQAAHDYFDYCIDNPLPYWECKRDKIVKVYKIQPMSFAGLCLYTGICNLEYYKKLPLFSETVERINMVIYIHNFTAAAVGLLNGSMIGQTLRQCF